MAEIFTVYLRPKLEYASQAWNPLYKSDITLIENVQRRYTKFIPGFYNLPDARRLLMLNLTSLELRRLQLDLIYTYKLLHGYQAVNYESLLKLRSSVICTRGHELMLCKEKCRLDTRLHFFANRVVNPWNALPINLPYTRNISSFKILLRTDPVKLILSRFLRGGDFDVTS